MRFPGERDQKIGENKCGIFFSLKTYNSIFSLS